MSKLPILLLGLIVACAQAQSDLLLETILLPGSSVSASRIAVRFTNLSSHPLALPTDNFIYPDGVLPGGAPAKGMYFADTIFSCFPLPGLIAFRYDFVAENAEIRTSCGDPGVASVMKPRMDIAQRAKAWTVLAPQASTTREVPLARVLPIQAGRFREVQAVYCSPTFSPEDSKKLEDAGIRVSTGNYISTDGFSFETDGQSLILLHEKRPEPELHSRPLIPAANPAVSP